MPVRLLLAAVLALATSAALSAQTTFTVTTTADAGPGSLRQAILDANANAGADLIAFAIPGAGPHTIAVATELPPATDAVTIDGLTQPGTDCSVWPATLQVVLNGAAVPSDSNGLTLSGGNSTVRGLAIQGFREDFQTDLGGAGVFIGSDGNTVACTFLGTDVTGTSGTSSQENGYGIRIEGGDNNTIGGTALSARNLISNNDESGIRLRGGATGTVIQGNFIGTNAAGSASLENGDAGIRIDDAPGTVIGGTDRDAGVCNRACNLISGNDDEGILILGDGGDGAVIQGNFIGTDLTGTASVFNDTHGVMIDRGTESGSDNHIIGGMSGVGVCSLACNLISGNDDEGILIDDVGIDNVTIQGNFIGTDVTGTVALLNRNGIEADGAGHVIGGATAGLGNLISGNEGVGIEIDGDGFTIQGNLIGVAIDGTTPLSNGEVGLLLFGRDSRIGGTAASTGNTIANNGGAGIFLGENVGDLAEEDGNAFLGNAIYANGALGIDIGANGVSGNDTSDGDVGPNNFQNFPVLDALPTTTGAGTTTVSGSLNSLAGTDFRLEFFATDGCDASSFGEGQTFIGATDVTTDGSGDATFNEAFATGGVSTGWVVTATATRLDGSGEPVETSEFSQCAPIAGSPLVTTTAESGPGSFSEAITFANRSNGSDVITFALDPGTDPNCDAGTGVCTLQGGALPAITGTVTIDGLSQAGASCDVWPPTLKVVFQGRLTVDSQNTHIRGVVTPSIFLEGDGNTVTCSFVGTDAAGTGPLFGGTYGGSEFRIDGADNTIGGTAATDRNLISAHNGYGLTLNGTGNVVQGNFFGTDVTGTAALPNRLASIRVTPPSSSIVGVNTIGGTTGTTPGGPCTGACNLISGGQQHGISLENFVGADVTAIVQGNVIGADMSGAVALPNALDGIRIQSDGHTIGGMDPEEGNVIAYNGGVGVAVLSGGFASVAGTGNRITGNALFSNTGPGIDLEGNGTTANDAGDTDVGANNLQNVPVLASVTGDGIALTIDYSVDTATANAAYPLRVEFFLADADGEEGQTFLGAATYESSQAQIAAQAQFQPTAEVPDGAQVVATAIDADGNTSEFSAAATVSGGAIPVELVRFEAVLDGAAALLTWETASETVNAGFEVQRRAVGAPADTAWAVLDFVESTAPSGTTSEAQAYRYTDTALPPGVSTLRYRLRQVDFDGAFAYSPEVEVALGLPAAFALEAVYPNPVRGEATVAFALPTESHVRLAIYDVLGRRVALLHDGPQAAGRHTAALATAQLAAGVYVVRFEADGVAVTRRVTVLR